MPITLLKKLAFPLLFCISPFLNAQNVQYKWARNNGGSAGDGGVGSVTDNAGNVFTTGHFVGTVDFDPGPGVSMMTALGLTDIFIAKYDPLGNFIWARQIGSAAPQDEQIRDIAMDGSGNLFFTGSFFGTCDFDPGTGVFNVTCTGTGYAAFFLKLDNNGNFSWAKNIAQSDYGNVGVSIASSPSGNLFVTGTFKGLTDLDPGPGTNMVTSSASSGQDIFISRFDNNGNYLWSKQFYSTQSGFPYGITVDASENIFTTGVFFGSADFDPGPGNFTLSSNTTSSQSDGDAYITKLDASGNFVWAKQTSGNYEDVGLGMCLDPVGNVIVTGFFSGTTDFDPGPGSYTLSGGGRRKGFVLKLSMAGNFIWVRDFNGAGNCGSEVYSVDSDINGDIYTTGAFNGSIDFDGEPTSQVLSTGNNGDVFISKLNANGSFSFAKQIGNNQAANGFTIQVDNAKNIYVAGYFMGTVDFDPNAGVQFLSSNGYTDAFILKLSQCLGATSHTLTLTACSPPTVNGQTYTSSGTYTQLLTNATGCDSLLTINLTLGGSLTVMGATACDSYVWEGNTYTTSGTYSVTYRGADGCDSIRRLNLVIRNRVLTNYNITLCQGQTYQGYNSSGTYIDTYTASNGCDSIRTLNLVIKPRSYYQFNTTICEGQSYWGHSTSGIYSDTLIASNGCDSVRTLQLQVLPTLRTSNQSTICEGQTYFAGGAAQTISGIYRDTLTSSLGCDSIIIHNLIVNAKPVPQLGVDKDICKGTTMQLNPGNFNSYNWQNNSITSTFSATSPGLYWVRVTNSFGCTATDSLLIKNELPVPQHFLKDKDSVCQYEKLQVAPIGSYQAYQWSTGATQPFILVSQPGQYRLTVRAQNGCSGSDTVIINAKSCPGGVWIPSAFTPNNDGRNDMFKALVYGKLISFKLQVYNRWGELIFASSDPGKGWNGKLKGLDGDTAVFTWICEYQLEGLKREFRKGLVTMIK